MPLRPGISWPALQRVWRFSFSMNALAILTVLIVQFDRLLISKLLTLDDLGTYTLAYTTAAVIPALISATSMAILPAFASAHGQGSGEMLVRQYYNASRFLLYVTGMAAGALLFFGKPLLSAWVNPVAGAAAAPALALLAIGYWGSAAVSNAYQVAIATGRPNIALKVSALTAAPYFLGLYGLVSGLGLEGAALAWLLLNAMYVVLLVPQVHHRILAIPVLPYFQRILLPFTLLVTCVFGACRCLGASATDGSSILRDLAWLAAATVIYAAAGVLLLGTESKLAIRSFLSVRRIFSPW
jgi:O-antigen/teichoic acid export membrane protein